MSLSVVRSAYGADDCPSGMVDDGDGGCTQPVPPTGGLEPYADPNYVPPTGGLYDYGVTGRQGTQDDAPTATGMTLLALIALTPLLLL